MDELINVISELLEDVTSDQSLELFQAIVQWSAIVLSALAGVRAARRHGMDYFGTLVIGFVSCVGGGTLRDVLLGNYPIFWLSTPIYLVTILAISLFGFVAVRKANRVPAVIQQIARPVQQVVGEHSMVYLGIDSLALGLWAYLGTLYALQNLVPPIITPVMGVVTASFGGVIRDVFFARIPEQFMPGQIYAGAAAIGAIVYLVAWWGGQGGAFGFIACVLVTFAIRMLVVRYNITSK